MKTLSAQTKRNHSSVNAIYCALGFSLFSLFVNPTWAANTSDLARAVLKYGTPVKSPIKAIELPLRQDLKEKPWEFIDEELFMKAFETRCWKGGKKSPMTPAASC